MKKKTIKKNKNKEEKKKNNTYSVICEEDISFSSASMATIGLFSTSAAKCRGARPVTYISFGSVSSAASGACCSAAGNGALNAFDISSRTSLETITSHNLLKK